MRRTRLLRRQEAHEPGARPPAEDERSPARRDTDRPARAASAYAGNEQDGDGAERHQHARPLTRSNSTRVERQRRPLPAAEVEAAHHVAAERARPEQVEEHADEVEADVVGERPVEPTARPSSDHLQALSPCPAR